MNHISPALISVDRVKELIECYGADPDTWPIEERAAAKSVLNQSEQLQQLQTEEERLDRWLTDNFSVSANSNFDVEQILMDVPTQEPLCVNDQWKPSVGVQGVVGLLCVALGFAVSVFLLQHFKEDRVSMFEADFEQWALTELQQEESISAKYGIEFDVALLIGLNELEI